MVALLYYIGINKVWDFCPKIPPKNLPNIYFLTTWKHWLSIAKPKNVFRSALSLCTICHEILKISYLTDFLLTDWLSDYLTDYLTLSDKHNSTTTKAMRLISSLFNITSARDVPFHQPLQPQCLHDGSSKAYLCSPLFSILFSTTA